MRIVHYKAGSMTPWAEGGGAVNGRTVPWPPWTEKTGRRRRREATEGRNGNGHGMRNGDGGGMGGWYGREVGNHQEGQSIKTGPDGRVNQGPRR